MNSRSLSVPAVLIGRSQELSPGLESGHVTTCWLIKSRRLDFQRTGFKGLVWELDKNKVFAVDGVKRLFINFFFF